MVAVGVLVRGLLVECGEWDGGDNNVNAVVLLGLQLCFGLLSTGDQDLTGFQLSLP